MAQQPPTRNLLMIILKNFVNSFRPRQIIGNLKGSDYFGNKYFEIPADLSKGKSKTSRWFVPTEKDEFEQEIPAEWEAWLRYRRKEPPSEEEVLKNLAIMQMKKRNAIEIEKKSGKATPMEKGIETFPKRHEYEIMPGKPQKS